jgi:conjugal transfer pilus assembly protein TraW
VSLFRYFNSRCIIPPVLARGWLTIRYITSSALVNDSRSGNTGNNNNKNNGNENNDNKTNDIGILPKQNSYKAINRFGCCCFIFDFIFRFVFVFMLFILFVSFLTFFTPLTNAEDYGKHGNMYEIQEEDLLEYIQTKLQEMDMEKWQKDFKEKSMKYMNRPKPTILPYAEENKTYYYDPSIVLQRDYADNRGIVFAKRGTRVNPLDTVIMSNTLIFIDGDNKQQFEYALKINEELKGRLKIILTNGAVMDLINKNNIKLYFDQDGILSKKIGIQHIPAIVSQLEKLLKIEEVALDYE